jgi:hypothetical protein
VRRFARRLKRDWPPVDNGGMPHLHPEERSLFGTPMAEDKPAPQGPSIRWELVIGVVLVVALVGWLGMRAVADRSESIVTIRNHPASFDGRTVALRGKVGEVFDLGGSSTYLLHQGRDTIVVFTRGRAPVSGSTVMVHGSVSIGYLDGAPRAALFEGPGGH